MHGARRWVRMSRVCGGVEIVDLVGGVVTHLTITVVEVEEDGGISHCSIWVYFWRIDELELLYLGLCMRVVMSTISVVRV